MQPAPVELRSDDVPQMNLSAFSGLYPRSQTTIDLAAV